MSTNTEIYSNLQYTQIHYCIYAPKRLHFFILDLTKNATVDFCEQRRDRKFSRGGIRFDRRTELLTITEYVCMYVCTIITHSKEAYHKTTLELEK